MRPAPLPPPPAPCPFSQKAKVGKCALSFLELPDFEDWRFRLSWGAVLETTVQYKYDTILIARLPYPRAPAALLSIYACLNPHRHKTRVLPALRLLCSHKGTCDNTGTITHTLRTHDAHGTSFKPGSTKRQILLLLVRCIFFSRALVSPAPQNPPRIRHTAYAFGLGRLTCEDDRQYVGVAAPSWC